MAKRQSQGDRQTESVVLEHDSFELDVCESSDDAIVVRGVKLLGLRSKNKRNYDTVGVRESASSKLVGAPIFINHPVDPSQPRSYADQFGVVESYEYRPGRGHFGAIKVNPHHAEAKRFLWDVKNNPRAMGMSINAVIRPGKPDRSGDVVVEELLDVRSVDVVTRPGTANGIFEQETAVSDTTVTEELAEMRKALAESQAAAKAAQDALEAERAKVALAEKRVNITEAIGKAVDGTPLAGLATRIVECACQMQDPAEFEKLMGDVGALFVDDGKDIVAPAREQHEDAATEGAGKGAGRAPQVGGRGQKPQYGGLRSTLGLKAR